MEKTIQIDHNRLRRTDLKSQDNGENTKFENARKPRNWLLLIILVMLPIGGIGCMGSVHSIARDSEGGVISIPKNTNTWPFYYRRQAEMKMAQQFPNGYEIIREEQAIIPPETYDKRDLSQSDASLNPYYRTYTGGTQRERREYRIYFRGRNAIPSQTIQPDPTMQNRSNSETGTQPVEWNNPPGNNLTLEKSP